MPVHDAAARGFERGADDYEKARPGHPAEVLELLRTEMPVGPRTRVCDLAAGTGKLTRGLLTTGADVVAIEPVAAMRRQLKVTCPDAQVLDGTAEAIPLDDHSVDVVTVAQAFHWFDVAVALAEIRRVLRGAGGLAMVWNRRDEREPWVAEMSAVIGWPGREVTAYSDLDWPALVRSAGGFTDLRHAECRWDQPMTRDTLAARVRSISYISVMEPAERDRLAEAVVDLVADRSEPFPLPYVGHVYWCHHHHA